MSALRDPHAAIPLPVPPHSADAEQSVLGALLIDNNAFVKISGVVTDSDFYRDDHRRIFRHISRLIDSGQPADVVTVDEAIKASEDKDKTGGITYLATLAGNTPSAHNVRRYAEIVRENSERRAIQASAMELHDRAARGDLEDCQAELIERVSVLANRGEWGQALDLSDLASRKPNPPSFIMDDWLPTGYATLLAGHGGVGKSAIALHFGVCAAAPVPFFGVEVAPRRVLYVSCEDREDVLHWRLSRICSFSGITLDSLTGKMCVLDLVGRDAILWERDLRTGRTLTPTFTWLKHQVRQHRAQVLIVDGVSDTFGGSENSRGDVKRFVNALLALIPRDGALLLIGHVAKPTVANGSTTEGYSGSTGWHNAVRARWYLRPETSQGDDDAQRTGNLILELQKSNLGRSDQSMVFKWDEDFHLFVGEPTQATRFDRKHQDRAEQTGILKALKGCAEAGIIVPAAMQGPRTAYLVLSLRPEFPESLKGNGSGKKQRFRRQIEELRQLRSIHESEYQRKNRHSASQLMLTAEGMRQCVV